MLLMYFIKEYFNSFDDIQFFSYIFINISRYEDSNAKRNTPLYSEFYALQDDIFFKPYIRVLNLRFSSFYEHFRQLREKYAFKLKIKYSRVSYLCVRSRENAYFYFIDTT